MRFYLIRSQLNSGVEDVEKVTVAILAEDCWKK